MHPHFHVAGKKSFFGSFLFVYFLFVGLANAANPPTLKSANHPKTWMANMESSLEPLQMREQLPTSSIVAWLGWTAALVFFLCLLGMLIRQKRLNRSYLRGDCDFVLMPPANNRRRRPR